MLVVHLVELCLALIALSYVVPVRLGGRRCYLRLHRFLRYPRLIPIFIQVCWGSWRGDRTWERMWE